MKREPKALSDAYEAVFAAIAHPVRRRILMTVNFEGGAMQAGAIAEMFEHAWPTTTRHLRVLVDAELLHDERRGRSRVYRIDTARLELARAWFERFSKDPGGSSGRKRKSTT